MRIAIMHNSLNPMGGGEKLCLATIEAFKERGWKVTLATVEPTDWSRVRSIWGDVVYPDKEVPLIPIKVRAFGIYMRIATVLMIPVLRKEHDVVINTHGDVLVSNADITYMHYPTFVVWDESYSKYKSGFWRMYFTPYYAIHKRLVKKHFETLLLTNSNFSKNVIRKVSRRNALVIYPPVEVEEFMKLKNNKRKNSVVSIGRFSWEKRYEFIVEVAEKIPDVEFHILGSVHSVNMSYYEKIKSMIEEKNLKNVFLHPNAPQKKLYEIISESKVYLHAMINEHFGIAVVEGMAGGLIPVVHKSGGAWTDIVEYGKYGYGYTTLEEAVKCIRSALGDYEKQIKHIRKSALRFSKDKYKKKIVRVVERYVGISG